MPRCPPQLPPMARLRIRYCGLSKGQTLSPPGLFREREVLLPVDRHRDAVRRPGGSVDVKGAVGAGNQDVVALIGLLHVVVGSGVNVGVHASRIEADVLHDVDLAARRPPGLADVRAERPDGRPRPPALRQPGPNLDSSVGPVGAARQAGRGVVGALEPLAPGFDHQQAVLDARVLRPFARVVLPLVVTDEADLVVPAERSGRPSRSNSSAQTGAPPIGVGPCGDCRSPPQAMSDHRTRTHVERTARIPPV